MELVRSVQAGGGRDTQAIASGADTLVDLSAFAGRYVKLTWDQSVFFAMIPSSGTFALSTSGAVAMSAFTTGEAASGTNTIVGERVFKDATNAVASIEVFVSARFPRLIVRAQGTSATYTEVKVTSNIAASAV